MPLSINVGLSRKASKDFQSTGTSINVTAELDQSLLARPDELQRQIDALYQQAEAALDRHARHADGDGQPSPGYRNASRPSARTQGNYDRPNTGGGNGRGYRNGGGNGSGRAGGGGPATDSQRRAINAIASRLGVDPHLEARDVVGADLADLTIRQASDLIDHLKGSEPAGNGRNGSSWQ